MANSIAPYVILLASLAMYGCHVRQSLPNLLPISNKEIEALEIKRESYVAIDSTAFMSMRTHHGVRLFDIKIDSAFMSVGKDTLTCYGHVSDYETHLPLRGVHVWAGRVWKEEASVRNDDGVDSGSISLYYMYPGVQSRSDEEGRFEMHMPLVGNTYLALFSEKYFARVYEIGLLMSDSMRLRLPNPGAVMRGGRM